MPGHPEVTAPAQIELAHLADHPAAADALHACLQVIFCVLTLWRDNLGQCLQSQQRIPALISVGRASSQLSCKQRTIMGFASLLPSAGICKCVWSWV